MGAAPGARLEASLLMIFCRFTVKKDQREECANDRKVGKGN